MAKVRAALVVVLIGLSWAGLVLGQDSDPCREAYVASGLSARQVSFAEFRGIYGETTRATDVGAVHKDV